MDSIMNNMEQSTMIKENIIKVILCIFIKMPATTENKFIILRSKKKRKEKEKNGLLLNVLKHQNRFILHKTPSSLRAVYPSFRKELNE